MDQPLRASTLPKGFTACPEVGAYLSSVSVSSLWRATSTALLDQIVVWSCGIAAAWASSNCGLRGTLPAVRGWLVSAPALRGIECGVHKASHGSWTRAKSLNGGLANLLAAWPVLSTVDQYRNTHLVHHWRLGTVHDADCVRWIRLRVVEWDRSRWVPFTIGLLRRIVPYILGWWWALEVSPGTVARFVAWHSVAVLVLIGSLGPASGILVWATTWAVLLPLFLPALRSVAEIGEHDYEGAESLSKATYNNLGWLHWLFHPHGDAYHALHHLQPAIPAFRIGSPHRWESTRSDVSWGAEVHERTGLLTPPRTTHGHA
jgi:fatty acid desaturase